MSTDIRPELSKKNPYWLPKHRYYELKHFVMQYPEWNAARNGLSSTHAPEYGIRVKTDVSDPTMTCAELRVYYSTRIEMVERASAQCGCPYYVLRGILDELSYEKMLLRYPKIIRYTRDHYYDCYRKFFWLLNQERH